MHFGMDGDENIMNFREWMELPEYDFLRDEQRLGRRIILFGLGGSYAYGTNNEENW